MIHIYNLSKNFGKKVLFDGVSLNINRGEKIGLLGPNGAGKSTLFSMILGRTETSPGTIVLDRGVRIGYLPQEASFSSERTVLGELVEGDDEMISLNQERVKLEEEHQAHSDRYGDIQHRLEALGYFDLEHKAKKVLMGLEFKESDFNRPVLALSGGWQMRTLLAKLLTCQFDILLLDEPTNYLDLNAALWLKDYLNSFNGTFVMISHDRAFLNEVTNYTLVLEGGLIHKIKGNYEQYEKIKEEKRKYLAKQFIEQEKKRKQLEEFIARFHGQPNKASQVRAKKTAIEKMPEIIVPRDPKESIKSFHFPPAKRSGHRVISLEKISKSYGDNQVYKDFDFEIDRGEKAVLVGENGAGKSTLLKIMAGVVDIDSGKRTLAHNVDIGYFSQTRLDILTPHNTVLREAYTAVKGFVPESALRSILGAFLFTGDDIDKEVSVLSGGEKSRLILVKLLINPPNLLLLDEPTTHLDVDAVEALVKALEQYDGTIVFISHDMHFVRSMANTVFEVKAGSVRKFPGRLDYYLEKKQSGEYINFKAKTIASEENMPQSDKEELGKNDEKKIMVDSAAINQEIDRLKKEADKLNREKYVKSRIVSTPRTYRDNALLEEYTVRLQEIDAEMADITEKIRSLKKQKV